MGNSRQWGGRAASSHRPFHHRGLRFEALEERRLLSITVDTLADEADGSITDGDISLRDAIALAPQGQTIDFSVAGTITLTLGELVIGNDVAVTGPGAILLTVEAYDPTPDAGDGSRIFNIDDGDSENLLDVSISGLTLMGGDSFGNGGAIFSYEDLTVTDCTISGSSSLLGDGGGISSEYSNLTIARSTISGNTGGRGGGVSCYYGDLTVTDSLISGNTAAADGGGISFSVYGYGNLTVTGSTISGNLSYSSGGGIFSYVYGNSNSTVTGSTISGNVSYSDGGGIFHYVYGGGNLAVTGSTISGNSADGRGGGIFDYCGGLTLSSSTISGNSASYDSGGGVFNYYGDLTVSNSTISGNSAYLSGGGLYSTYGQTTIRCTTITQNEAGEEGGGGVASYGEAAEQDVLYSSIVVGNTNGDVQYLSGVNTFQSLGYNLIGTGNALDAFDETGDQPGVADPMLGPLAANGGTTWTHALLAGSPAIDAGDPSFDPYAYAPPLLYDQRGAPFARVAEGTSSDGIAIDIGAFELMYPLLLGDYNEDGSVDAADYAVWRDNLSASVTPYGGADGSGDGVDDEDDYAVWKANFGHTLPTIAGTLSAIRSDESAAVSVAGAAAVAPVQPPALPGGGPALRVVADDSLAPGRMMSDAESLRPLLAPPTIESGRAVRSRPAALRARAAEASNTSRQDDLLLAWSRALAQRGSQEGVGRHGVSAPIDGTAIGTNNAPVDALDVVFESLGG